MQRSPAKLLDFLKRAASGRLATDLPTGLKRLVRLIPKTTLEAIAKEDPRVIDDAMIELALAALGIRSDDAAPAMVLIYRLDRSTVDSYAYFGDVPIDDLLRVIPRDPGDPNFPQEVKSPGA